MQPETWIMRKYAGTSQPKKYIARYSGPPMQKLSLRDNDRRLLPNDSDCLVLEAFHGFAVKSVAITWGTITRLEEHAGWLPCITGIRISLGTEDWYELVGTRRLWAPVASIEVLVASLDTWLPSSCLIFRNSFSNACRLTCTIVIETKIWRFSISKLSSNSTNTETRVTVRTLEPSNSSMKRINCWNTFKSERSTWRNEKVRPHMKLSCLCISCLNRRTVFKPAKVIAETERNNASTYVSCPRGWFAPQSSTDASNVVRMK